MMKELHKCVGRVWGNYSSHACGKNAAYEHAGKHFCKTHHPPTVDAKAREKREAWGKKFAEQQIAYAVSKKRERAEKRYIELFPDLLALLVESQSSIGGDWRERRDALIAKAQGET